MSGHVVDLGPQAFARIIRRTGRTWLEIAFPEDVAAGCQYVGVIAGDEHIAALRDLLNAQTGHEVPTIGVWRLDSETRVTKTAFDEMCRKAAAWDRAVEEAKSIVGTSHDDTLGGRTYDRLWVFVRRLTEGRP